MSLTAAQLTALAADIAANSATVSVDGGPQTAISAVPHSLDASFAVAAWYNLAASPNFFGNYRSVPLSILRGAITWAKLTSNAAMPATPSTDTAKLTWINQCMALQTSLQLLLGTAGQGVFDATPHSQWQGLKDSLSAVPSKSDGTTQDAGWAAVQVILCRLGTNAEKLFADVTNGNGSTNLLAAAFTFEGTIQPADVQACWGISG
jgi:hypothetical protein